MRFITRSLTGLFLFLATLTILGVGAYQVMPDRDAEDSAGGARRFGGQERVVSVSVATSQTATVVPRSIAYGEIRTRTSLDLRSGVGGFIQTLSDQFRDGGEVRKGALLFQIDPADLESAKELAQIALDQAKADLTEAEGNVEIAETEITLAQEQLELRKEALSRQQNLRQRGVVTDTDVETAKIALSTAEQSLLSKRQSLLQANATVASARVSVNRAEITLREAQRDLAEAREIAPFDGVLSEVSAVKGRRVSANETLGTLVNISDLEVSFPLTNTEYARITGGAPAIGIPVEVSLQLDNSARSFTGKIERVSAVVEEGRTGREVFAKLDLPADSPLRPGDFVTVSVAERPLSGVSTVPASAVSSASKMMLVSADNRLEELDVTVLRRTGNEVIVSGLPQGRDYVTVLQPQHGQGLTVKATRADAQIARVEKITLSKAEQASLISKVNDNAQMPDFVKERLIKSISTGSVTPETYARLTGSTAPSGPPETALPPEASGDMVTLTPEQQSAFLAALAQNSQIPAPVKTRMEEAIKSGEVSQRIFDRLSGNATGGRP